MIHNIADLIPGSLIFLKYKWDLKKVLFALDSTKFKYTHIAIFLGKQKVIEDSWVHTKITPLENFLNNNNIEAEVVVPFSDPLDVKLFLNRVNRLKRFPFNTLHLTCRALYSLGIEVEEGEETIEGVYHAVTKKEK